MTSFAGGMFLCLAMIVLLKHSVEAGFVDLRYNHRLKRQVMISNKPPNPQPNAFPISASTKAEAKPAPGSLPSGISGKPNIPAQTPANGTNPNVLNMNSQNSALPGHPLPQGSPAAKPSNTSNAVLPSDFNKLSKTDKQEAMMESSPKGMILQVIKAGDSRLHAGDVVDGNLNLVKNATSNMTSNLPGKLIIQEVFLHVNTLGNDSKSQNKTMDKKNGTSSDGGALGSILNFLGLKSSNKTNTTTNQNAPKLNATVNSAGPAKPNVIDLSKANKSLPSLQPNNPNANANPQPANAAVNTPNAHKVAQQPNSVKKGSLDSSRVVLQPAVPRIIQNINPNPAQQPQQQKLAPSSGRVVIQSQGQGQIQPQQQQKLPGQPAANPGVLQPNLLQPQQPQKGVVKAERVSGMAPDQNVNEDQLFSHLHSDFQMPLRAF